MGLGGISIWQLLIILAIVILIFGTKRLKTLGGDLGGALRSFRKAMDTDDSKAESKEAKQIGKQSDGDGERKDAEFAEQEEKRHHG